MSTISIHDIERDPNAFVKRVEAGEVFLVVRGEATMAEVRPINTCAVEPRPFGLCTGRFTVPEDFDRSLPENILEEFES